MGEHQNSRRIKLDRGAEKKGTAGRGREQKTGPATGEMGGETREAREHWGPTATNLPPSSVIQRLQKDPEEGDSQAGLPSCMKEKLGGRSVGEALLRPGVDFRRFFSYCRGSITEELQSPSLERQAG